MGENYVEMRDFNGLGTRVSDLDKSHAACRAETMMRHENLEKRMNEQGSDIKNMSSKLDSINSTVNKGVGIMIAVNAILVFVIMWAEKTFK